MSMRATLTAIVAIFTTRLSHDAPHVPLIAVRSAEEEGLVSASAAARVKASFAHFMRALSRGEG